MLKAITIKNYALIDNLSVELGGGFSAITGETGAGKSILLGALSIILGARADLSVLKNKTVKCVVEGEFDLSNLKLKSFFEQHDLDYDNAAFLRREILPSGKSRAFINDTPVTLNVLKTLGEQLVNIHSQHQTLMLSDKKFQLNVIDSYLRNDNELASYRTAYSEYVILNKELLSLQEKESAAKQEQDYLQFQFDELDSVSLDADEFEVMEERQQFLSHSEEVMEALNSVNVVLHDSDDNVTDRIKMMKDLLSDIVQFYPKAEELISRLESVRLELKDLADETVVMQSEGEVNPLELSELTAKLDDIYRLQQKHRVQTIKELIALKEEYSEKLLNITGLENEIARVAAKLKDAKSKADIKANKLSGIRKKGVSGFVSSVQSVLAKLGMKDALFEVRITPLDKLSETGKDKIEFWFSANKGVNPGEISKIASGGELSRLMLALKSLVNEKSFLPTVVFDEIDSGVSGDIAGKVGNIMKEMAIHHQLIAITHLPQIASKADRHYKVFKETIDNTTRTNIILLDDNQRVDEIASMLSDSKVTKVSKEAAKELLKHSVLFGS